jgi:hypothetical protein
MFGARTFRVLLEYLLVVVPVFILAKTVLLDHSGPPGLTDAAHVLLALTVASLLVQTLHPIGGVVFR